MSNDYNAIQSDSPLPSAIRSLEELQDHFRELVDEDLNLIAHLVLQGEVEQLPLVLYRALDSNQRIPQKDANDYHNEAKIHNYIISYCQPSDSDPHHLTHYEAIITCAHNHYEHATQDEKNLSYALLAGGYFNLAKYYLGKRNYLKAQRNLVISSVFARSANDQLDIQKIDSLMFYSKLKLKNFDAAEQMINELLQDQSRINPFLAEALLKYEIDLLETSDVSAFRIQEGKKRITELKDFLGEHATPKFLESYENMVSKYNLIMKDVLVYNPSSLGWSSEEKIKFLQEKEMLFLTLTDTSFSDSLWFLELQIRIVQECYTSNNFDKAEEYYGYILHNAASLEINSQSDVDQLELLMIRYLCLRAHYILNENSTSQTIAVIKNEIQQRFVRLSTASQEANKHLTAIVDHKFRELIEFCVLEPNLNRGIQTRNSVIVRHNKALEYFNFMFELTPEDLLKKEGIVAQRNLAVAALANRRKFLDDENDNRNNGKQKNKKQKISAGSAATSHNLFQRSGVGHEAAAAISEGRKRTLY